ncbi:hypothetical protein HanRHA438_Chr02g0049561 [Helianthus annuus]|nr:hypothetical protein HanIR_Chr02g0054071 [Helianthus annuus]KAJ0938409.1 hypothetical protein HanRHA438_Chr02g0049561 [Helianthus annuus]
MGLILMKLNTRIRLCSCRPTRRELQVFRLLFFPSIRTPYTYLKQDYFKKKKKKKKNLKLFLLRFSYDSRKCY